MRAMALGRRMMANVSLNIAVEETIVESFLFLVGALAMIVGLLAMIEGHLHCFGILQRKKGRP
jgi:hypothetical protein